MKKRVMIMVIALGGIYFIARVAASQSALNEPKSEKVIAVAPTNMAVLYVGVENPVDIAISDLPIKYITATVDSGEIENKGEGKFVVKINSAVKSTKINVFENYNGVKIKIGERFFRVKHVPDPVANIAGVNSGTISKSVLAASVGIIPLMRDFDFDLYFRITSFTFTISVKGGDLLSLPGSGNRLTPAMISKIQSAPTGTKVYFEDINAKGPDGTIRGLSPICLKLIQ